MLFEGDYWGAQLGGRSYDIAPDGQRFLMIKDDSTEAMGADFFLVQNFFEELKARVPN